MVTHIIHFSKNGCCRAGPGPGCWRGRASQQLSVCVWNCLVKLVFSPPPVNPPSGCSQTTLPFLPATPPGSCSSPTPKVRVAELVVERMQQFKRVAPEQLKLSLDDGSVPKAAASGDFPARSQEQNPPEDGTCLLLALVGAEWVAGENGYLRSSPGSQGFVPGWPNDLVWKSLQIPEKTSLKDDPYFLPSSSPRLN